MGTREVNLKIRVTQKEYQDLLEMAQEDLSARNRKGEVNISLYCRKKLFSNQENKKEVQRELRELIFQIRKIGVNINQAVKRINSRHEMPGDETFLLTELTSVERLLLIYKEFLEES